MTSAIGGISSMVSSLFSKIDTSNQGYIDKTELQSAFDQITSSDSSDSSSSDSVDAFFTKFDSDSDGKISKQEMTDGLTQLAQALDNQYNQSRLNGSSSSEETSGYTKDELTSMIDELGDTDSKRTTLMSSIVSNFDSVDTNGDGTVSNEEAMAYDQTLQSSSSSTSSTSTTSTDSTSGYSKDELTSLIKELGDTDSKRTSLMSSIVSNFDSVDTNGDGKVSDDEAMTYAQTLQTSGTSSTTGTDAAAGMPPPPPPSASASSSDSTSASTSTSYDPADTNQDGTVSAEERLAYESSQSSTTSNDNMNVMKMMMQLVQAYGLTGSSSTQSTSSTISATA